MKIISLAALLCASLSAQAALWSSTNASVRAGAFTTSMLISLSGDQRAVDAQVDITIPFGVSVTVTPLNGAACAVIPPSANGYQTVRVLRATNTLAILGNAPVNYCQINIVSSAFARSGLFYMSRDLCVTSNSTGYRCDLDPGFLTVLP
jgi:hypothetical protein